MDQIKTLHEKKARLAAEAKSVLDAARNDKREAISTEEQTKVDAIYADIDALDRTIDALKRQDAIEKSLTESVGRQTRSAAPSTEPGQRDRRTRLSAGRADYARGLRAWLLDGTEHEASEEDRAAAARVGIRPSAKAIALNLASLPLSAVLRGAGAERVDSRLLQEWEDRSAFGDTNIIDTNLGEELVPTDVARSVETALLQFGSMRGAARVIRTATGNPISFPTGDDTANAAVIVAESDDGLGAKQELAFDAVVSSPKKYSSKLIPVSLELLQDAVISLPEYIGERIGQRIARGTEGHFATGNGTTQPEGLLAAATNAVTGATGTLQSQITFEKMLDLVHACDPAYRGNARFMFHDTFLKLVRGVRDAETDELIWQTSAVPGAPNTILGYPYTVNQAYTAPGAAAKCVTFGDHSTFMIRDVVGMRIQRLDERFAEYGVVGFVGISRHDSRYLNAGTDPVVAFTFGALS